MTRSRHVMLVALAWFAVVGVACTQRAADETRAAGEDLADAAGDAADRAVDTTKEIAEETADTATEIVGDIATATKDLTATTGEAITDTWITAKVKAKFIDEAQLESSRVTVDTDNRVVTLRGTVASPAAKSRAEAIASGTEGVTRVVNQLVVT